MEGKHSESKHNKDDNSFQELAEALPGFGVEEPLLIRAAKWFVKGNKKQSSSLSILDDFANENCGIFVNETENPTELGDGEGHSLECHSCHKRYLEIFEDELEQFVADENSTLKEFYDECNTSLAGESLTIVANEDYKWFVDLLMQSMDYNAFHIAMVERAQSRQRGQSRKK